jgi:hypothetical protein
LNAAGSATEIAAEDATLLVATNGKPVPVNSVNVVPLVL